MNLVKIFRGNIFLVGIVILTITLLISFGVEQSNKNSRDSVDLVNELYSSTFKPIFASDQIKKSEVLTFALDGNLTLDSNQNKVLKIQNDSSGHEVIGIEEDNKSEKNNFKDYYSDVVNKLNLTKERKIKLDSILNSYANSLSNSVYSDKNKVFAVDQQIAAVRTNLNRDLTNFLKNETPKLGSVNPMKIKPEENDFYIFAPDTIVKRNFLHIKLDSSQTKSHDKFAGSLGVELKNNENFFDFHIDSNYVNVTLDNLIDKSEFEDILFLKAYFNDNLDLSNMLFELKTDTSDNYQLKFIYNDSTNSKVKFEVNSENIDKAIENSVKQFSGKTIGQWIEYGIKMDSLTKKQNELKNKSIEK